MSASTEHPLPPAPPPPSSFPRKRESMRRGLPIQRALTRRGLANFLGLLPATRLGMDPRFRALVSKNGSKEEKKLRVARGLG